MRQPDKTCCMCQAPLRWVKRKNGIDFYKCQDCGFEWEKKVEKILDNRSTTKYT